MNKNTKIIKIFSKQLKRKQTKCTTPTNYLKNMEFMTNIIENRKQNSQILHANLQLTKWMFIMNLKQLMLSIISSEILVRNCSVKY